MADNRPIGVFDSGVGGLTVVRELRQLMPFEDIIYFGDTGRVPYGNKSAATIKKYARQDEEFLLKQGVKLIIAACGTVSSVAADTADGLPVPFMGVVAPSARAAAGCTKNKKVGVLGTVATINSGAHQKALHAIDPAIQVYQQECSLFVPLVEAGWFDRADPVVCKTAHKYLDPLIPSGVDTLILGCTHYPLLAPVIRSVMGEGVALINMGQSLAEETRTLLETTDGLHDRQTPGTCRFYVSDLTGSFCSTASLLLGQDISMEAVVQVTVGHP